MTTNTEILAAVKDGFNTIDHIACRVGCSYERALAGVIMMQCDGLIDMDEVEAPLD